MTVATLRPDGWPQATTIGYMNEGVALCFLCGLDSQKAKNLARDDRISLTIDHDTADLMATPIQLASILVQARPERLVDVEAAILPLGRCDIYGRDPIGKPVVVIDAPDAGELGTMLKTIALLPGVYSASLVVHAIDASWQSRSPQR